MTNTIKPVVALDLDELMFPFVDNLIDFVNAKHSTQLTLTDYTTFTFEDIWNCSSKEAIEIVHEFFFAIDEHPEPLAGSIEAIRQLESDFELLVVTARADELRELTLRWIGKHFPDVFAGVHLCNLYIEGRTSRRTKADVCREAGAIALVDDSFQNVVEAAEAGLHGVLFGSFPWNQYEQLPPRVRHATDWDEVIMVLKEIA